MYVLLASSVHFGICKCLILNPRNKPNKDSTKAIVRNASDWEGIFTHQPAFFLPLGFFLNSNKSFIEYSNVTYGFEPCALWPTWYRKRALNTLWCMQWHQEVIAELIALYFIAFHEVEPWEYELSGYFLFWLSIFSFRIVHSFPVSHSSVKYVPMRSSMTLIQSNRCIKKNIFFFVYKKICKHRSRSLFLYFKDGGVVKR